MKLEFHYRHRHVYVRHVRSNLRVYVNSIRIAASFCLIVGLEPGICSI